MIFVFGLIWKYWSVKVFLFNVYVGILFGVCKIKILKLIIIVRIDIKFKFMLFFIVN